MTEKKKAPWPLPQNHSYYVGQKLDLTKRRRDSNGLNYLHATVEAVLPDYDLKIRLKEVPSSTTLREMFDAGWKIEAVVSADATLSIDVDSSHYTVRVPYPGDIMHMPDDDESKEEFREHCIDAITAFINATATEVKAS